MNKKNIDVSNSDLLDASYLNFDSSSLDPNVISAGISTGKNIIGKIGANKTDYERNLKASCGSKINIGKKAKEEYSKCVDKFNQNLSKQESEKTKQVEAESSARSAEASAEERRMMQKPLMEDKKKFLGMPMGVGITVTVILVGVTGFFVWKKFIKK